MTLATTRSLRAGLLAGRARDGKPTPAPDYNIPKHAYNRGIRGQCGRESIFYGRGLFIIDSMDKS